MTDEREEFQHDPVDHVDVAAGMSVGDLAATYADAGFGGGALAEAVDVYAEMLGRGDVTNFLGLAGAMVPAGMRQLVVDLVRDGHVDALVTTGAPSPTTPSRPSAATTTTAATALPKRHLGSTTRRSARRASTASTTSTSPRSTSPPSSPTSGSASFRRWPTTGR